MVTHTIQQARREAIAKGAYAQQRVLDATAPGVRRDAESEIRGMAKIAADVLGVGSTPWAFELALREALAAVGRLDIPTGSGRDKAAKIRAEWVDAIVADVEKRIL